MSKKTIGISFSEANFQNYWNWFTGSNPHVNLIELSFLSNNVSDFEKCDGFVLTGGIDVVPDLYGGSPSYPNMPDAFLPARDEFEKQIYHFSQQHRLPLLGICRGMQYINILEGGKVIEDNEQDAHEVHKRDSADKVHQVQIEENSLLHACTGLRTGEVNSAHHQAIDPAYLGHNLMAVAYSATKDQLIEAIEFKDKTSKAFMIGVQWHPERMLSKESNPLSQKIKDAFLQSL